MRAVFIINPVAGKGKKTDKIRAEVDACKGKVPFPIEIYLTQGKNEVKAFMQEYRDRYPEEELRFYACGGDGTVSEVVGGVIGLEKAAVGVIPCGSGNDFIRNFLTSEAQKSLAFDIEAQLRAAAVDCDVIRYEGILEGKETVGYCANMVNIGFDANVADSGQRFRKYPLMGGSLSYFAAILTNMIGKNGADLTIEADGEVVQEGPLLMSSLGNGQFCGGGIQTNPLASLQDGFVDAMIVSDVPRRRMVSLLPAVMKGRHLEMESGKDVIRTLKAKSITVTPKGGSVRISIDGEIYTAGKLTFTSEPLAFQYLLPKAEAVVS